MCSTGKTCRLGGHCMIFSEVKNGVWSSVEQGFLMHSRVQPKQLEQQKASQTIQYQPYLFRPALALRWLWRLRHVLSAELRRYLPLKSAVHRLSVREGQALLPHGQRINYARRRVFELLSFVVRNRVHKYLVFTICRNVLDKN